MTTAVSTTTPTAAPTAAVPPTPPVSKGRKGAAAGGGKAWTEEEEVYLLQMRLERVAYKKIAQHLEKTELACRLHYHQLSHGGNRRKRTNSTAGSSTSSSTSTPETPRTKAPSFSAINGAGAITKATKGKPLLPKPAGRKPLRVNCAAAAGSEVDRERLARIVRACEAQLWASVAAQYGDGVDGEQLKRVWQEGGVMVGSTTPPTPAVSPAVEEANEVSTPVSSVRSPTVAGFEGVEVAAIKEEMGEEEEGRFKEQSVSDTDADADAMEA